MLSQSLEVFKNYLDKANVRSGGNVPTLGRKLD